MMTPWANRQMLSLSTLKLQILNTNQCFTKGTPIPLVSFITVVGHVESGGVKEPL